MDAKMKFVTVVARNYLISEVKQLRIFLLPVFSVGNQDGGHKILSLLFQ